MIFRFLTNLLAFSHQYRPHPEFHDQLLALRRTLPKPMPIYDKKDAWVSLAELERIGLALWPKSTLREIIQRQKQSGTNKERLVHAGATFARHAGLSLMLRLWTYIPYRQRNIREMKIEEHLYKDPQGKWRIRFVGEQLKVAVKKGKTNIFDLPFPLPLVPVLETYIQQWRPILAKITHEQYANVFLNGRGKPYTMVKLLNTTKFVVYRYTGRHWHPHIIRTVWATEWIKNTHGDFYTASVMLNDRLETVIANYAYLLDENVAEKAYRLITERNGYSQ
jgi:hypothetical protein